MTTKEYDDAGTALAVREPIYPGNFELVDEKNLDVRFVAWQMVVASHTNPRKHFNAEKLQDLADSIKASGGLIQAVLVRPLPGNRLGETFIGRRNGDPLPSLEIVSGERRWRAIQLAGLAGLTVQVRELTDDQVLEIQLAENMQRDDLSALEEAEAFFNWMEFSKHTADEVAARVKKSRKHVYNRLKLLSLCPEARKSFEAGSILLMHALPIASIPDTTLQLKALNYATTKDYKDELPSVRQFDQWIKENLMRRLAQAPFDVADVTLHATAGACGDCPKRTGANPDLFAVQGPDYCTDVACFKAKDETHRNRVIAIAEKKGVRLVEGKEAKQLINNSGHIKGYTRLDIVQVDAGTGQASSLRKLLGKDAPPSVLIEHPHTRELIEVVPTTEADSVLIQRGAIKQTHKQQTDLQRIEHLRRQHETQLQRRITSAVMTQMRDHVRAAAPTVALQLLAPTLLRAWLLEGIDTMDTDDLAEALFMPEQINGKDRTDDDVCAAIQAASDELLCRAVATVFLESDRFARIIKGEPEHRCARALAAVLSVDVDAIVKAVTAAEKKALQAAVREIKAESTAQPPSPAGRGAEGEGQKPKETTEGGKGNGEKTPVAKGRKGRASAEETMSGIAAAMQGLEASAPADAGSTEAVQAVAPTGGNTVPGTANAVQGNEAPALAGAQSVMYRCARTGSTWSGRGQKPAWVRVHLEQGGTLEVLRTNSACAMQDLEAPAPADAGSTDELLVKAIALITKERKVSRRMLKTGLNIGTERAEALLGALEKAGKIGPSVERGTREVLV